MDRNKQGIGQHRNDGPADNNGMRHQGASQKQNAHTNDGMIRNPWPVPSIPQEQGPTPAEAVAQNAARRRREGQPV